VHKKRNGKKICFTGRGCVFRMWLERGKKGKKVKMRWRGREAENEDRGREREKVGRGMRNTV
jgi:hypothetical protein